MLRYSLYSLSALLRFTIVYGCWLLVCQTTAIAEELFNGKDLTGWHADVPAKDNDPALGPSFIVRDGMLVSLGTPPGHLITDASHENYRLVVEYRFPGKPGNCGVLVHASTPRALYKMFPKSIEVQMNHEHAGDFWCIVEDITVPDMVQRRGPKENWGITEGKARRILNLTDDSEKPLGEWNEMIIECFQDQIKVWVNGDLVNHGTNCTATKGQIAVQAEGAEVEFRKLDITPIKKLSATAQEMKPVAKEAAKKTVATDKPSRIQPEFAPPKENPKLPNVLLIGDSISIGYTLPVRERLSQEANVWRPTANCGPTTRGVADLDAWLGDRHWDVIHFNFGLHDLRWMPVKKAAESDEKVEEARQVSLKDYEANLRKIVTRLKKTGATLIWCETTPVPDKSSHRIMGDEEDYNAVADKVMREMGGIRTDDLHGFAKTKAQQLPANVHYTTAGSEQLADHVAASIRSALAARSAQQGAQKN